jgi:phosphoenolpyruvate-protein kinase (PTS system EI component)
VTTVTHRFSGTGVAPGTAVAASWRIDRPLPTGGVPVDPHDVAQAFHAVAADLERVAERARAQGRPTAADIVAVGALIAGDPDLIDTARRAATAADPLRAIHDAVEGYAGMLDSLPDETLRERAADVRQVGRRVLERIARTGGGSGADVGADVGTAPDTRRFVLVADQIGPADLLEHLGQGLVGAVTVRGGANSHAAIVARSVGLPLVTGVDPQVLDLPDHTALLVDADAGLIVADPAETDVAHADAAAVRDGARRAVLAAERGLPHVTADGQPFVLLCNVASDIEVRVGRDSGAVGIGLLRTELPFLESSRWPDGADHRRALRPILAEATGWPVTVRLLDFANDKIPPFLHGRPAGLPALLDNPAALTAQLRAAIDLGRGVQLRIMVPMVVGPADVRAVRAVADDVVAALGAPPVQVGAMVETLAAVEAIDDLCAVADFLSIGTNDLTAEVLDLDRTDPRARPELTAHPSVLTLVARVVAGAARAGRPVTVCGDAGSHPTTLPLLLGAGVRAVSVACARIDETRYRLRRLDTTTCADLFTEAVRLRDADETAALVRERMTEAVP